MMTDCLVGYVIYNESIIGKGEEKEHNSQFGLRANNFPIIIPPTHLTCPANILDISIFIFPASSNRLCTTGACHLNIDTLRYYKSNFEAPLDRGLVFRPICDLINDGTNNHKLCTITEDLHPIVI